MKIERVTPQERSCRGKEFNKKEVVYTFRQPLSLLDLEFNF